ncbi:MAG: DUF423 domain-containing protein [Flavobacteriia bacterium]|nr:DUF423 domain-containing protein [Flavobacteriia bacterium]
MRTDTIIRKTIISGVFLIFLGIILGSIAAHGLKKAGLDAEKIASFEVGVRLQMYTGMGLLLLAGIQQYLKFSLKSPVNLMLIGVTFFSGSIYFLSTKQIHGIEAGKIFPLITPVGGMLLIISWAIILIRYIAQKD